MRFLKETQTKTKIITIVAILSLVTGLFGASDGQQVRADTKTDLQNKLNNLNNQINDLSGHVADLQKQKSTLATQVNIYDSEIQATELQIQATATEVDDTTLQIDDLQTQIERRRQDIADNQKVLAQLIVQLNELDNDSYLSMTLSNNNFSDFLDQMQYVQSVNQQVYDLVQKIKEVKARLESQQSDLKIQLQRLQDLQEQQRQTQDALNQQRADKQALLDQTRGQESKYQKVLASARNEQADVLQEIQDLDTKARSGGSRSISASKGVLAWPMDHCVLTQGYGNTGFTALGYTFHNGIDCAGPAGTPIYAAANGTVLACGTGETAYGNWCAIKHTISTKSGNRQIVTLYGHMRKIVTSGGKSIQQGNLVGFEGNTGNTSRLLYGPERGYHLHFSVFDANGFTITPGKYANIYGPYSVPNGYTYNPLDFLGGR